MMMGHHEQLKGGDEYDHLTRWRCVVHCRPGQVKATKRGFWKRQRRTMGQDIIDGLEDAEAGRTQPADEAFAEIEEEFDDV